LDQEARGRSLRGDDSGAVHHRLDFRKPRLINCDAHPIQEGAELGALFPARITTSSRRTQSDNHSPQQMRLAEFAYHLVNEKSTPSLRDAYLWRRRLDDFADDFSASNPLFKAKRFYEA